MIGHTISHYRIQSKLGAGGMGVVYKAEDIRLERNVALKFLAPHLVSDETVRRRFQQEAKAVAALDHPNICTVYEIDEAEGTMFLAMGLVEGDTVKAKIAQGILKIDEILHIAVQVAEGIAAAHAKGIVHRDIKPANIMVNQRRQVKVMDFGLARLADATMTLTGHVAGTPAYMSPEQVQGQTADERSDIWALGVTLYEMVTGRLPFRGERMEAVLLGIQSAEPQPVTSFRADLPPELDWIVGKCLAKNPAERYQKADELQNDLSAVRKKLDSGVTITAGPSVSWSGARAPSRIPRAAWFASTGFAAVLLAIVGWRVLRHGSDAPVAARTVKFTITPSKLVRGSDTDIDAEVSISRDGKHITYVEAEGGQLWVRDLDQEQARVVPGAVGVYQAFWSPDNQFIGYVQGGFAPGLNLMKIPAQGGTPSAITRLTGAFRRAAWSSDGKTIVYCDTTGMYTVPSEGGQPTLLLEHPHIEHPSFLDLPDGSRAILHQSVDPGIAGHGIYVRLPSGERRRLIVSSSSNPYPAYSPSGHIVYVDGTGDSVGIWALPFSVATLQPVGKPFRIAEHGSSPQVSSTATLVYSDVPPDHLQLGWYDRSGKRLSTIGDLQAQFFPTLSPDGRKLAVVIREGHADVWVLDLDRGVRTRLTSDPADKILGGWSGSADSIVYSSTLTGNIDIYSRAANANGEAKLLAGTPEPEQFPDWSADGRFLIYEVPTRETKLDLLYRERGNDGTFSEPKVFLNTPFSERAARFSPDGRFVVYVSDESGQPEVYVRDFPSGANKWQISAKGGAAPRWTRDGKAILYVDQRTLMSVSVATRPAFSPGKPAPLFQKQTLAGAYPQYDVSPDGKRFVMRDRPEGEKPLSIHVAHNWFEDFRGRQDAK